MIVEIIAQGFLGVIGGWWLYALIRERLRTMATLANLPDPQDADELPPLLELDTDVLDQAAGAAIASAERERARLWYPGSAAFWLHPKLFDERLYDERKGRWQPVWCNLPDDADYDPLRELMVSANAPTAPPMPCGCPRSPPGVSFVRRQGDFGQVTCLRCGGQWPGYRGELFNVMEETDLTTTNSRVSISSQGVLVGAGGGQVTLRGGGWTYATPGVTIDQANEALRKFREVARSHALDRLSPEELRRALIEGKILR